MSKFFIFLLFADKVLSPSPLRHRLFSGLRTGPGTGNSRPEESGLRMDHYGNKVNKFLLISVIRNFFLS